MSENLKLIEEVKNKIKNADNKNFNLRFNRYVYWTDKDKAVKIDAKKANNFKSKSLKKRKTDLSAIAFYYSRMFSDSIRIFDAETQWRLIVGLGSSHPAETSMTLDHIYGIPYIPGSAIKGVLNHYWIKEKMYETANKLFGSEELMEIENALQKNRENLLKENKKPLFYGVYSFIEQLSVKMSFVSKNGKVIETLQNRDEIRKSFSEKCRLKEQMMPLLEKLLDSEDFQKDVKIYQELFGTQERIGKIIFFDAFPVNDKFSFVDDVMTPHFGDYYGKTAPPADYLNPNPIKFLTVKGTFRFIFIHRPLNGNIKSDLLKEVSDSFTKALEIYGIGAKTAVGYGRFENFKDVTDDVIRTKENEFRMKQEKRKKEEKEKLKEAEKEKI